MFIFCVQLFVISILVYNSRLSITYKLVNKAQRKHKGKEIIPLRNRLFEDGRVDEDGKHYLHYQITGDKSSHMVWIKDRSK